MRRTFVFFFCSVLGVVQSVDVQGRNDRLERRVIADFNFFYVFAFVRLVVDIKQIMPLVGNWTIVHSVRSVPIVHAIAHTISEWLYLAGCSFIHFWKSRACPKDMNK